ncbi:MAG: hypothetical protein Q7T77_03840 [Sulfuricurvum sp.]|nr:hypothetical protein [Sulfuricurvum sp.]
MKMDMVKEFEDFIYWLKNEFVDYYLTLRDSSERGIWESLLEMHLKSANYALAAAKLVQSGSFEIKALNDEAEAFIKSTYSDFFELLPEQAFIGRRDTEK